MIIVGLSAVLSGITAYSAAAVLLAVGTIPHEEVAGRAVI